MVVGLTGGIGSGKTTVGKMFAALGVPVYNSDLQARRLMETNPEIKKEVVSLLGEEAYQGTMPNRAYIAEQVFGDQQALNALNAIIHPRVRDHFRLWAAQQTYPYTIQEAAVLFENGSYRNFDRLILVVAPQEERIRRIKARDGSDSESIIKRMAHQWEDVRKEALSDFVIVNEDLEKTRAEVGKIHSKLLENVG